MYKVDLNSDIGKVLEPISWAWIMRLWNITFTISPAAGKGSNSNGSTVEIAQKGSMVRTGFPDLMGFGRRRWC